MHLYFYHIGTAYLLLFAALHYSQGLKDFNKKGEVLRVHEGGRMRGCVGGRGGWGKGGGATG